MNGSRIRIRDIMLRRYLRLGESHTLHEVMGFLTDAHFEDDGLPFLVVIAEDGNFAGVLQPSTVLTAMLEGVQDGANVEASLRERASVNLSKTVGHIMTRNIPEIDPESTLELALTTMTKSQNEVIAVIEDGHVIGLVTARILFQQASTLTVGALSGGVIPSTGD